MSPLHSNILKGKMPCFDDESIFDISMEELSKMDKDEFRRYQDSIDMYRSNKAAWDFRYEEGFAKGAKKSP